MTRYELPLHLALSLLLAAAPAGAVPPPEPPAPVPAGKEAVLSLGVRAEKGVARHEVQGFVGLTLPLERLAAPRRAVALAETDAPPAGPTPAATPRAEPEPPRGAPAPAEPLDRKALSGLARGAIAAARRAERVPERERALDGLASRARLSALLPEVRFRVARTRDESLRLTPTTDDPYRFTLAGGDALVLEGGATFRLSNLLFADDELAVERLRLERERGAERRVARVLDRVLAWYAALTRLADPGEDVEHARLVLELDAAALELDVLTDGWFGARVESLGVRAPSFAPAAAASTGPPVDAAEPPDPGGPRLDALRLSARSCEPCLPMHETDSRTFKGASTR